MECSVGSAWENFPLAFWKDRQALKRKEDIFLSQRYGKTHRDGEKSVIQCQ